MPTVAEIIVDKLIEQDVQIVFGLPGGENVPLLEVVRRKGIEFVLVRNESSAIFMADVTARLTGKPCVALSTLGPGAMNAVLGMAHAYLDRAPVLLLTAHTDISLRAYHTHQVLDLQACFQPITKLTRDILAESVYQDLDHAFQMMTTGRPGPAHLSVSRQTLLQEASESFAKPPLNPASNIDVSKIEVAKNRIAQSQRPVIVLGLGLEPEKPYQLILQLAEVIQAPVIDTPKSKGAFPADNSLMVGTIGVTHTDPAYEILDEADCIIAIGFDVVELVRPWQYVVPTIWIAPWENTDPKISTEFEFVGEMEPVLQHLFQGDYAQNPEWGAKRVVQFRKQFANNPVSTPTENRMFPADVLHILRTIAPDDTLITTDVGSHKIFTALNWSVSTPNRYMVSNGLSGMGFALPVAIAAAKVLNQPVICIIGDGGLAMTIGELSLLRELNLPVIIVMMNDEALDLIRYGQTRSNYPVYGTEFTNPDYGQVISGYGIDFHRVHNAMQCENAVQSAFEKNTPTFIEVLIDPKGYRL